MGIFLVYLSFFILCVLCMKTLGVWAIDGTKLKFFYFKTPYLSPMTLKRQNAFSIKEQLKIWLIYFLCLMVLLKISQSYLAGLDSWITKAYLMVPTLYFSLEFLGRTSALLFSTIGHKTIVDMHNAPWAATSLQNFWSKRWNVWVRDWILSLSKPLAKLGANKALFFAFMLSGVFHEMMVSLPYFVLTNKNVFGLMIIYFGIQFIGMWLEKKYLNNSPYFFKIIYTWIFILIPIPLFINQSILYFYGLL